MLKPRIPGMSLSPLKLISHPLGDILHIIRSDSGQNLDIAEVYASCITMNSTKGWKRHLTVPSIVVISGSIDLTLIPDITLSFLIL